MDNETIKRVSVLPQSGRYETPVVGIGEANGKRPRILKHLSLCAEGQFCRCAPRRFDDHPVVLEPDEVASAVPENDKTLTISAFLQCGDIDSVYFDRPYYLAPSDKHAEEAFGLIREEGARDKDGWQNLGSCRS